MDRPFDFGTGDKKFALHNLENLKYAGLVKQCPLTLEELKKTNKSEFLVEFLEMFDVTDEVVSEIFEDAIGRRDVSVAFTIIKNIGRV
jgi:hypothetical protein